MNELAPISGFKIKLTASNSCSPKIILVVPNTTEIVVDMLEPGTEYVGQIAAINLHGMSEYSAVSSPIQTLRGNPIRSLEYYHFDSWLGWISQAVTSDIVHVHECQLQ